MEELNKTRSALGTMLIVMLRSLRKEWVNSLKSLPALPALPKGTTLKSYIATNQG